MRFKNTLLLSFFLIITTTPALLAQDGIIHGFVRDSTGKGIEAVSVSIVGQPGGVISDIHGRYEIHVPPYKDVIIGFATVGYSPFTVSFQLTPGEQRTYNAVLHTSISNLHVVTVKSEQSRDISTVKIEPRTIEMLPSVSGNFESVLKTMPGVVSNNELSSTYSVRGGNFDENLVYVNDIEIYRPFLIRSGQQEGLSFINSDLVSGITFSSGGFGAMYGDKLSSVLDIKYRSPQKLGGSAYVSLLGAGFHLEGLSKNEKFSWLAGFRQKSNQFLLSSLDTKGDYKPSFTDFQTLMNYKISSRTEISVLGNYSVNKYRVIPSTRQTEFGNINEALRFTVYFDGQEVDKYTTSQGAISLTHKVNDHLKLKLIGSAFTTKEQEFYDILGEYYLDELEKDLGSSQFGNVAYNKGIGAFLDHARDELTANVFSLEHKGYFTTETSSLQWGLKFQHEAITDKIDEWQYRDSADFSIVHPQDNPADTTRSYINQQIVLNNVIKNNINLQSNRVNGFLQNSWNINNYTITAGIRATYWDLNKDFNFSPRASIAYKPVQHKNLSFRFSTGYYYQPPFYRELRGLDGTINKDVVAQRSIHFVLGSDYQFLSWGRVFKLTAEAYYKKMDHIIPYKVDDTRIRYLAKNDASGYATGLDLRVNGEFVSGIESWASLSFLKTEENLNDDSYYTYYNKSGEVIVPGYTYDAVAVDSVKHLPGNIPRPSDQRVTFSIFFQDYLPKFPSYRVHLNLIFGTGLPYGPPGPDRYKDILRGPSYRRVDIGFSKMIIDEDGENKSRLPVINKLRSLSVSLEIFNLLQVSNTVSYTWITDVTGRQYGVPNYLTSRIINLKLQAKF